MLLQPLRWVVWAVFRVIFGFRYRFTVRGKPEVLARPGPYLILPNHPAFIDPPNMLLHLWPTFQPRPLVLETNFRNPVFGVFGWLLRAIKVPDISTASADNREQTAAALANVVAALKAGQNVIIWPSGKLQRDGTERLGGARTAADVLAAVPNVTVVLARTRGLWGTMFSFAGGTEPFMLPLFLKGIGLMVANLFVFTPRRPVTVTLEAFGPDQRPEPTRAAVNAWLQQWFNADFPRGEPPTFVRRHFLFGRRSFTFPPPRGPAEFDTRQVKPETKTAVAELLAERLKRPLDEAENKADVTFARLGLDSLDAMELTLEIEQRFGVTSGTMPTAVGHLWALADGLAETAPPKPPPAGWFAPPTDDSPLHIDGATIPAAILNRAFRQPKDVIAADDLAGGVTFEKLLVGAGAMSRRFRDLPGPNVGLLLPASVACDLGLIGLHLAGKLPVLLNWTTGPANLGHAVQTMGLSHVVTSKAFIDRTQIAVPGAKYLFLEDVRAGLGKVELLRRLLAVRWLPTRAKRMLLAAATTNPDAPAVVLFTSGSEKAPKAVPLTHANILSNLSAVVGALGLDRHNSAIGFLPMFHSFGLTLTGILPLVTGVKIVHHPDPTDVGALARKIAAYKPTLMAGTPTFYAALFDRAKPGDLDSLRLACVGAEKCPPAVFDKAKQAAPHVEILEGYGITECSPVVSFNRPGAVVPGTIGRAVPGVELSVTDLDTDQVLPAGHRGMLNVCGPNVFPGYLGYDGPSPFREVDGKRWYVTGDLAELTPDGSVVFHGRLKRFLKAGGEMISLPALEEPLARLYPPTDAGPRVAVEGVETPTGRTVVLFTTEDVSLRDANAALSADGFRGVMRLDEVRKVPAIPVLGTGKTDYKVLRAMIGG